PSVAAPITTRASRADRILDLLCPETGGTARGADQQLDAASACNSAGAQPRAPAAWMTIGSQHCWLTAPRADRTGREWKPRTGDELRTDSPHGFSTVAARAQQGSLPTRRQPRHIRCDAFDPRSSVAAGLAMFRPYQRPPTQHASPILLTPSHCANR